MVFKSKLSGLFVCFILCYFVLLCFALVSFVLPCFFFFFSKEPPGASVVPGGKDSKARGVVKRRPLIFYFSFKESTAERRDLWKRPLFFFAEANGAGPARVVLCLC